MLRQRERGEDFVETLLDRALAEAALSPADRALCQELCRGVVRWQATLDWLIDRKTDGRIQKSELLHLLRLGLYQLFWLDRVPDHAAVHETVELVKRLGFEPQVGFVNALLRGYTREQAETRRALEELKQTQPHLGWSHPEWLVARWHQRWGAADTARLLEWNNTPPFTYARLNTIKTAAGPLLERWHEEQVEHENIEYDFGHWDWIGESTVFRLKSHPSLVRLGSLRDGWFYVQDPSTLLAVHVLDPQSGETVFDLCAAPGGKTTLIAARMKNQGRIVASDSDPNRLKRVQENCARLGVTCVETLPATSPEIHPASFDRILIDVPCSNTGVMRRRVDLRWRIRPEEITRLAETQLALLQKAAPLLKPGGVLVYSTCSLEPEENGELVRRFLANQTGFVLENERELRPFRDNVDGSYVARLRAS